MIPLKTTCWTLPRGFPGWLVAWLSGFENRATGTNSRITLPSLRAAGWALPVLGLAIACGAEDIPSPSPAEGEPVAFAEKPVVRALGTKGYEIAFAVNGACDATVGIEDGNGTVLRHLASGMLGPHAPPPFQKDALRQTVRWDGRDDRGAAVKQRGLLRAKVTLGLRPEFSRMHAQAAAGIASRGPVGMAVDRQGNLYVMEGDLWVGALSQAAVIQVLSVKAFDREGNYLRSLVPFRADRPPEEVSEVAFMTTTDGRRVPLSGPSNHRPYSGFVRGAPGTARHLPVVTSAGRLIFPCGKEPLSGLRRLISIGLDGSVAKDGFEGPPLQTGAAQGANLFLALSPDEKVVYFAGAVTALDRRATRTKVCHAVYRVTWEQREPAQAFAGREFESGTGEGRFNDPRGLDVDPQGRLYVCDYGNDRIQVFDPEGTFLKAVPVTGPEQVRVHPKTGALYVLSVRDRGKMDHYGQQATWEVYEDKAVVKFPSLDDWRALASIDLPKRRRYMHDAGPILVLDASQDEPVLWIANTGHQHPEDVLWKVADRGEKLEKIPHRIPRLHRHAAVNPPLAADRPNHVVYAFHTPAGHVRIGADGREAQTLELEGEAGRDALRIVGAASVGPEGMLYVRSARMLEKNERIWHIRRFDRKGALVPFEKAGAFIETNGKQAGTPFNEQATPFAVGPEGHLYVVGAYSREGRNCRMDLYGPDGGLLKAGLVSMTRSGGCVRVNVQGQLYAADTIRPKAHAIPPVYPADLRGHLCKWYGTVFRFAPSGGGVREAEAETATHFAGAIHAPLKPARVEGALWEAFALSPMPLQANCQCAMADFDADDWGRVWIPDAPGCCVAVFDAAGNLVTRFGAYGNRDALGAGSAVPDPPIPFWSPQRVAALDRDVFVADALNCRIVQVRLAYQAEETVWIEGR